MGLSFHSGEGTPEGTCPREGGREGLWGDRLLSRSRQDEQGSQNAILFHFLAGDSETWLWIYLLEILGAGGDHCVAGEEAVRDEGSFRQGLLLPSYFT